MEIQYLLYLVAPNTTSFLVSRRSRVGAPRIEPLAEIRQFLTWSDGNHTSPDELASAFVAWVARQYPGEVFPLVHRDSVPPLTAELYVIRCDKTGDDGLLLVEHDGEPVDLARWQRRLEITREYPIVKPFQ